jgi:hypothetical protein
MRAKPLQLFTGDLDIQATTTSIQEAICVLFSGRAKDYVRRLVEAFVAGTIFEKFALENCSEAGAFV